MTGVSTFPDMADAQITHQVEVHIILEQVEALDDVLVVHEAEEHDLRGDASVRVVLPPRVVGHLVLDDELDRDLVAVRTLAGSHDEAVAARAELVLEVVVLDKEGVEDVLVVEARRVEAPFAEDGVCVDVGGGCEGELFVEAMCGREKRGLIVRIVVSDIGKSQRRQRRQLAARRRRFGEGERRRGKDGRTGAEGLARRGKG